VPLSLNWPPSHNQRHCQFLVRLLLVIDLLEVPLVQSDNIAACAQSGDTHRLPNVNSKANCLAHPYLNTGPISNTLSKSAQMAICLYS
jgi:hypothetical protein